MKGWIRFFLQGSGSGLIPPRSTTFFDIKQNRNTLIPENTLITENNKTYLITKYCLDFMTKQEPRRVAGNKKGKKMETQRAKGMCSCIQYSAAG